jgi:hypothetical protein
VFLLLVGGAAAYFFFPRAPDSVSVSFSRLQQNKPGIKVDGSKLPNVGTTSPISITFSMNLEIAPKSENYIDQTIEELQVELTSNLNPSPSSNATASFNITLKERYLAQKSSSSPILIPISLTYSDISSSTDPTLLRLINACTISENRRLPVRFDISFRIANSLRGAVRFEGDVAYECPVDASEFTDDVGTNVPSNSTLAFGEIGGFPA